MQLKATHRLLSLLLPAALLVTSCSGVAPSSDTGSAETSTAISATEEAAVSMSAEAEIETPDSGDADISASVSDQAVTTSESQETTAVGSTSAGTENADALPAPYTMESYDTVPAEFQEWHDDIDYGTVEADVEYYSNTAGDYKYCNVLLPAGYVASQEYPVLYMFHGFGGRYDSHVHEGSILQTLYGKMLHDGLGDASLLRQGHRRSRAGPYAVHRVPLFRKEGPAIHGSHGSFPGRHGCAGRGL